MPEPTSCCRGGGYCDRCDLLVGLDGLHVLDVVRDEGSGLVVDVESAPGPVGRPAWGVLARGHGRREVGLVDAPAFGMPTRVVCRKRRWTCLEAACPVGVFTEQDETIARPRGAVDGAGLPVAIAELRREQASVQGLARRLGTMWRTVWTSIRPLLEEAAADPTRFDGVSILGVDEHVVRHEALLFRMEVRDLHRLAVAAAG